MREKEWNELSAEDGNKIADLLAHCARVALEVGLPKVGLISTFGAFAKSLQEMPYGLEYFARGSKYTLTETDMEDARQKTRAKRAKENEWKDL